MQGIWTNTSYTKLERPKAFTGLTISPDEARKAEAVFDAIGSFDPKEIDPLGQKDSEAWEVGDGLAPSLPSPTRYAGTRNIESPRTSPHPRRSQVVEGRESAGAALDTHPAAGEGGSER